MGYFRNWVTEAALNVRVSINELSLDEGKRILSEAEQRFSQKKGRWFWEHLKDKASIQNESAWRWVGEYINNDQVILFDIDEPDSFFNLQQGSQLVPLLEEMPNGEFYLTNLGVEYLICFNHHDYLIACGRAKSWLEKKIAAQP